MRAAAIFGLGSSPKNLTPFQDGDNQQQKIEWQTGLPASSDAADVVLLFGGDGTIHRHLGALVRLGLPVLIVPAGSGNDFARALGLRSRRDSPAAWEKFRAGGGNVRSIDLGVIVQTDAGTRAPAGLSGNIPSSRGEDARENGPEQNRRMKEPRFFSCVAGIGLDSEVARRANLLPRWLRGNGGYALTLIPRIFRFAPLPMKISKSVDGTQMSAVSAPVHSEAWTTVSDQPTTLVALANTPVYGGGMKIAPLAKMDDGLLDVCFVGAMDPLKLFCLFPTVYGGTHLKIREVGYLQAARVRVETEHPLDVYADGEFVCQTPVEVGIEPAALKIVGP